MKDPELENFLTNWGRWSRSTSGTCQSSNLYGTLKALAYLYGKPEEEASAEVSPSCRAVDEKKALAVEKALTKLPRIRIDDKRGKRLLMRRYLEPWVSITTLCRQEGVKVKQGWLELERTKTELIRLLFPERFHDEDEDY